MGNKENSQQAGTDNNVGKTATSVTGNVCSTTPTTTGSSNVVTKTQTKVSSKIAGGYYDKRVSLTVAPKVFSRDETLFVDKVKYVLGSDYSTSTELSWLFKGAKFYGLLRNALGTTSGLVFPYTPSISFSHKVNYETTDITHSNISYNYYRNTPCPSINISKASFTADNRKNALHMLSAIWFLQACTKCEFGEKDATSIRASAAEKGLPPPILYLNGYNSVIDNIPVVINSLSYEYPSEKHYVNLVLDMSQSGSSENFCKIYDNERVSGNYTKSSLKTSGGKITGLIDNIAGNATPIKNSVSSSKTGINLSFWLPTELSINIGLLVQPNFLKTRKQWNLDDYKTGLLLTDKGKNPDMTYGDKVVVCEKGKVVTTNLISSIPSGWTW